MFKPAVKKRLKAGVFVGKTKEALASMTLPRRGPPEYIVLPLIWSSSWFLPVRQDARSVRPKLARFENIRKKNVDVKSQKANKNHTKDVTFYVLGVNIGIFSKLFINFGGGVK